MVRALLEACGPVTSWKRMQDSDGRPKGFGFCEFKARVFSCMCTPQRGMMPRTNTFNVAMSGCQCQGTGIPVRAKWPGSTIEGVGNAFATAAPPDDALAVGLRTREPMPPLPEPKALACGVSCSDSRSGGQDTSGVQLASLHCWRLVDAGQPQQPKTPVLAHAFWLHKLRRLRANQLRYTLYMKACVFTCAV